MPGKIGSLIGSIRKKPSTAPDRKSNGEANGVAAGPKTSIAHDVAHLGVKNVKMLAEALPGLASGAPLDDKELLLEHGVAMLQSLPPNSGLSASVSQSFITMLYQDLPHPPTTLAGPAAKYRRHDGGGNNPWNPDMGKAGSPYSRSVPPLKPKGLNLPDPELVFEQLLKRKGPFREHPSGLNRLFFSFATIVIHECFQTSRKDPWINETSSYVDLSTLYGNTDNEQRRVRTYNNGTIYPDSMASERIMMMPPGVVALMVMLSRNHNSIAESLLSINENGKYGNWDVLDEEHKKWQDEDIFQLSRNINVGFFATVVLHDYVAAILNTPRANSTWSLDLGGEIKSARSRTERGTGNVVSIEFAVLYHWHAALSAADADWMETLLRHNLPELGDMDDMTPELFGKVLMTEGHKLMNTPPKEWTFGGLERGPDGRFNDVDLGEIIKDCIDEPAHAFGAHGTPASLKVVDILGQLQAREAFNVCTMNEFRRYLNLKAYESFEDWNPDKETARAAELLYGHIDNLELYPGLMAEVTKPPMPGSGVCPGQTTGRGILDDAVALVRGDRFLSYDLNSTTLTNWGVGALGELQPGSYGSMLPKLLFSGLPAAFTGTSLYALLPFYTPQAATGIIKGNKVLEKYDLQRPRSDRLIVSVQTAEGCKQVLDDSDNFRFTSQKAVKPHASNGKSNGKSNGHLTNGVNGVGKAYDNQTNVLQRAFFEDGFEANVSKWFSNKVSQLIKQSSLKYSSSKRSIDIVRDVCNVAPILWLAERFAIPIKTPEHPRGLLSLPHLFDTYMVLFQYQTFNVLPINEWNLRESSAIAAPVLQSVLEAHLKTQQGLKEYVVDWLAKGSAYEVGPDADRVYHALSSTKTPISELAGDCIDLAAPIAGIVTQQASLLVDLYLSPGYETYKERIVEIALVSDPASEKELQGFVFEGMRHAGIVPGLPRVSAKDTTIIDGSRGPIQVKAHQTILIATSKASMDPAAFPNPGKLDPLRPVSAYDALHIPFGTQLVAPAIAATLREIFKLKNVRRAAGRRGHFTIVEQDVAGVKLRKYLDDNSKTAAIPTTLTLEYDE